MLSVIAELALHMSQRGQKGDGHRWKELQKLDQFQIGRVILGSDGSLESLDSVGSQNDALVSTLGKLVNVSDCESMLVLVVVKML